MRGWIIPPPREPSKTPGEFERERARKVRWLARTGYLRSARIREALLRVRREAFVPGPYRDYAYEEVPLPLPGEHATISCPHSYPLFYEPLGLDRGHRFLEIGSGSGYGAAVAREVVGDAGEVVSVEIDRVTHAFATSNLRAAGYHDVVVVRGDGGLGCPDHGPYDRIAVTAACPRIPDPLIEQLRVDGRLIAPVERGGVQVLVLVEKRASELRSAVICEVAYISLRGVHGSTT